MEINLKTELDKNINQWELLGAQDPLWAILTDPSKKGNKWNLEEFLSTGKKEIKQLLESIENQNIKIQEEKCLDFGCGVGRLSQALALDFEEVWGVDISEPMIKKANEINAFDGKCHYYLIKEDKLSFFKNESFDFIYSNITLQHVPTPLIPSYLKEFCRILKSGGLLVFQLPSHPKKALHRRALSFLKSRILNNFPSIQSKVHTSTPALMDMNAIPSEEVKLLFKNLGAEIVAMKEDIHAGPAWISYQYFVRISH